MNSRPRTNPLCLSGEPVHVRLSARSSTLAEDLVSGFRDEIPIYRQLPAEELAGDILAITAHNLTVVARVFEYRRTPTVEELDPLRDSAARRAQEGVPLEAILTAYHLGARRVFDELFAAADATDIADVVEANRLILAYTQAVTAAVCDAYLAERESMLGQERDAAHAVVLALLNEESPIAAASLAGIRLANRYLVLSLRTAAHPDEKGTGAGPLVAGRRKRHRIEAELASRTGEPVLSMLDVTGGVVLVPGSEPMTWERALELFAAVSRAADVDVWATAEWATPAGVPDAALLTGELMEVVAAFDRPPGLYRLSDMLLEYQLTRPSPARDALACLLDPLTDHDELSRTLHVHLAEGLDRRATAARLHVHPNTVDYRLRRIGGLIGVDPTDPMTLSRIEAALAARRMARTRNDRRHSNPRT